VLNIKVFWGVTQCQIAKSYLSFEGKMSFKMLATMHHIMWSTLTEDLATMHHIMWSTLTEDLQTSNFK